MTTERLPPFDAIATLAGTLLATVVVAWVTLGTASVETDPSGCVSPIAGTARQWKSTETFAQNLDSDAAVETGEVLSWQGDEATRRGSIVRWKDSKERCFHYAALRSFFLELDPNADASRVIGWLKSSLAPDALIGAGLSVQWLSPSPARALVYVEPEAAPERLDDSGFDWYRKLLELQRNDPQASRWIARVEPDWLWGVGGAAPASRPSKPLLGRLDRLVSAVTEKCYSCLKESTWYLGEIGAPFTTQGGQVLQGRGVHVALIDSGLNVDEVQLAGRLLRAGQGLVTYNATNGSSDVTDDRYHGTKVAGVLAAKIDGDCTEGIAPEVTLVPIKVLNAQNLVTAGSFAVALQIVLKQHQEHPIDIVLSSVESCGGDCSIDVWRELKNLAREKILLVLAAGNCNADLDRMPSFPASYPGRNSLVIGASDAREWLSNRGLLSVHLAAPGACIRTLTAPGGMPAAEGGSSLAAPLVAGAAALALEHHSSEGPLDARERVLGGLASAAGFGKLSCTGGMLRLQATLKEDLARLRARVPRGCTPSERLVERWSCALAKSPRSEWEALAREPVP